MHERTRRHLRAIAHSTNTSPPIAESEQQPRSAWLTGQVCSRDQRRRRYLHASLAHPGKMLPSIARYLIATYTGSPMLSGLSRPRAFRTLALVTHAGARGAGLVNHANSGLGLGEVVGQVSLGVIVVEQPGDGLYRQWQPPDQLYHFGHRLSVPR